MQQIVFRMLALFSSPHSECSAFERSLNALKILLSERVLRACGHKALFGLSAADGERTRRYSLLSVLLRSSLLVCSACLAALSDWLPEQRIVFVPSERPFAVRSGERIPSPIHGSKAKQSKAKQSKAGRGGEWSGHDCSSGAEHHLPVDQTDWPSPFHRWADRSSNAAITDGREAATPLCAREGSPTTSAAADESRSGMRADRRTLAACAFPLLHT